MDWWEGLGTALVAGLVSAAVTLLLRAWDSHRVRWVLTGEAHDEYASGRPTERIRATLVVHNAGDGTAYRVTSARQMAAKYDVDHRFEAGVVPAGGSIEIVMSVDPDYWDEVTVELAWDSAPTARTRRSTLGPVLLREHLWRQMDSYTSPETTKMLRHRMRRPIPTPSRRARRRDGS